MVGVAQWAERLSVEQVVEGSNPFAHPHESHLYGWLFQFNDKRAQMIEFKLKLIMNTEYLIPNIQ